MSLPIWTPDALSSEILPVRGAFWRLVEAQHQVSTMKLVETSEEQALLETLLDETKPQLPPEARGLDYLLATPFRYGAAYPHGSRFRRAGRTPGVFYAAASVATAVAEMAFYRLLFFTESPATALPANPADYTAFAVSIATERGLDLTRPPLSRNREAFEHPTDYAACQALAETARTASIDAILYRSIRDPARGMNIALLNARGFAQREPTERQSWRIHLSAGHVQALCDFPRHRLGFSLADFAADPRLAARFDISGSTPDRP
ncbi:RES family NAD+ phosphorylase [Rhizobium sp. CSW-27]|uniref:RES family NAD+ phosphorylase n=1 Tax=Rhizobium sp. CSW-27 TaxID=2839985 RepID=UPI001C0366B5|nr:RES family NAD+ phosphorylase [Rhizobium sp. CSW-27]MBT9368683.1 RES family NAD+ phosphorylase [Rhizobium sp. CSW-27]